ncbi:MAG: Tim44-like domain-containing protein [Rhodocyclaceae bacterium]|nr:Tim44-like domain-containing protein [Rhodocyclaceae bacterium]
MKNYLIAVFTLFVGLTLLVNDADAKRLGGGTTSGMRRSPTITQRQATPPTAAPSPSAAPRPAPAAQPAPAPAPSGASRWLGPLAGLAAGVGIGALLGGAFGGMGGGMGGILSMLLMGLVAFFVIRMLMGLFRGKQATPGYAPAGAAPNQFEASSQEVPVIGGGLSQAPAIGGGLAAQETSKGGSIPSDFDVEGFLRQAKLNFVRLQAANDGGNMDDIKEVTTPEMYAEIKLQLQERGGKAQNTDVVNLNADLLDVTTEEKRHIASVRYFGTIREDGKTEAFDEVWHLVKPVDGSHGWTIAGIEQMQ